MAIHKNPPEHYLGYVVDGKVPVILIPGIFGKWGFMKHLGDALSYLGHPVHVLPKLGYNVSNIPDAANMLHVAIDKIFSEDKSSDESTVPRGAIIVAHSKGGLIGKYFLAHHNKKNHVAGMISIATPYSGSSLGNFLPVDAIEELDVDSPLIHELGSKTEVNAKIISIIPEYDNHVWSKNGSTLDGAENIHIPVRGHHKVVFSSRVIVQVCKSVEKITKENFL